MLAVFGLGNPGKKYDGTRHNAGFLVLDRVAELEGITISHKRFEALTTEKDFGTERVMFLKPQTFMNLSGTSVALMTNWYHIEPKSILVVCDDLALEPGAIRIRKSGSSGGHNGLKSVAAALGTDGYPRLRLGIGHPAPEIDPADYVLERFAKSERELIDKAVERAAEAVRCWINDGTDAVMNRFN